LKLKQLRKCRESCLKVLAIIFTVFAKFVFSGSNTYSSFSVRHYVIYRF